MYYVYVLENAHGRMYIGSSADADARLMSHNAGRVRFTKTGRPWHRVFLEEYADETNALKREKYLKSGWGRKELEKIKRRGAGVDERGGLENQTLHFS